jgi:hypothetical protein
VRIVEVVAVQNTGDSTPARDGLGLGARPGSKSTAYAHWGSPRNLGDPDVSAADAGQGSGSSTVQAHGRECPEPMGANNGHTAVPLHEGDEVQRDGQRGVRVLRITEEAGEPTRGTQWREGGTGTWDRWRERCRDRRISGASPQDDSG